MRRFSTLSQRPRPEDFALVEAKNPTPPPKDLGRQIAPTAFRGGRVRSSLGRVVSYQGPRGRTPRKRTAKKSGSVSLTDAYNVAMKAWQTAKWIRGLVNVEQKFHDSKVTFSNIDNAGVVLNLSNIAQGDDVTERTGDSILLRKLEFRLLAVPGSASTRNLMRIILFRDMQQDGTDPTVGQVLEDSGTVYSVISPLAYFYADGNGRVERFKILHDEVMELNTVKYPLREMAYEKHFNSGSIHIWYDATASADASNREGALYVLLLSDISGANNGPSGSYYSRITFTDN